jgi:hypothetical protein
LHHSSKGKPDFHPENPLAFSWIEVMPTNLWQFLASENFFDRSFARQARSWLKKRHGYGTKSAPDD